MLSAPLPEPAAVAEEEALADVLEADEATEEACEEADEAAEEADEATEDALEMAELAESVGAAELDSD